MSVRESILAVVAGLFFGAGITVSGAVDPARVKEFLDVTRVWDPSLGLVIAGALAVAMPAFALARKRARPVFAWDYRLPGRRRIDLRLVCGAAIFGIGWGLVGFSPGTVLAAIGTGAVKPLIFLAAMLAGMAAYRLTFGVQSRRGADYARRMSGKARPQAKEEVSRVDG